MTYTCAACGGPIGELHNGTARCPYCGVLQTFPISDDERIINLYNNANMFLKASEFDKAQNAYEQILAINNTIVDAQWGAILCKYGVQYVFDQRTGRQMITCNRTSFDSILAAPEFHNVMANSDQEHQQIYYQEANEIDRVQQKILEKVRQQTPYDIFISYKETDDTTKQRTVDSVRAYDLYEKLSAKGYRVFFSRVSLEVGTDYEPVIYAALNSAKIMLVIGSRPEYFNAPWVKNEWGRFMTMMRTNNTKQMFPCYFDMDPYNLPLEFRHLQAQNLGMVGADQDIIRGIEKILRPQTQASFAGNSNEAALQSLLIMGMEAVQKEDWLTAGNYFETALRIAPHHPQVLIGKVLTKFKVKQMNQLAVGYADVISDPDVALLYAYGDDEIKKVIDLERYKSDLASKINEKEKEIKDLDDKKPKKRVGSFVSAIIAIAAVIGLWFFASHLMESDSIIVNILGFAVRIAGGVVPYVILTMRSDEEESKDFLTCLGWIISIVTGGIACIVLGVVFIVMDLVHNAKVSQKMEEHKQTDARLRFELQQMQNELRRVGGQVA